LSVTGEVALDSSSNGSIALAGNAKIGATGNIYTTDPNTAGVISGSQSGYSGTVNSGPYVPDPYAGLTPPSTTGLTTYSDGTYHGPGIYTSTLSLAGSTTQTFASGIYILEQGISVTGNAGITAPGGVLFYVTGGSVAVAGNGGANLQPLSSPPSPASGLVVWQVASDTNAVTLAGNGSASLVNGTIYAPGAQVGGAGNGGLSANSVVANSLSCDGNGSISIG
jgi:hypothetical protein